MPDLTTATPRRRRSRARIYSGLATLVLGAVTACGSGGDAQAAGPGGLTHVDVGILPIVTNAPLALGVQKGFFKEEGLDVTTHVGQGGAALLPAVISGQYDFAFSNNVSLLLARSKGLPVSIIAAASSAGVDPEPIDEAIVVPASSPVKSLADLRGATVAVNTLNNIVEVADRVTLEKAGVDLSTVKFIEIPFPDMPAALAQGRMQAAHIAEPHLTRAVQAGARIIAHPYRVVQPDVHISSWFASDRFIKANPDTVQRFTRALERSRAYAAEHTDEVRAFIPGFLNLDPALAKQIALGKWPAGMPSEQSLRSLYDATVRYGLLKPETLPDPTTILRQG
ncbi:ABC transporter substrate-binding protein [Pseudonocardia acidicola]|uniref:ABC transporter substrate-binding protein n=1 Tax=Pseudonocardia acidicola TaxID=2724939 RepID=A0ABX1S7N1_9PSEU|nr:ABC transporter substrate-binding protein [Pseudonocardia acidicola]NMH96817.1 ABC transporter substrate-binding protein [Pseudonocardia acidicola]